MGYKKALQEQASAPNQSSLAEHPPPGRAGTLEVERGKGQGPSATYSQQVRNEPATQTLNPADTLPNNVWLSPGCHASVKLTHKINHDKDCDKLNCLFQNSHIHTNSHTQMHTRTHTC